MFLQPALRTRLPKSSRALFSRFALHTDAHHPRGLYWHDLGKRDDQNVYALSFLKDKPLSPYSITNIGLVRGQELDEKSFEPARDWVQLGSSSIPDYFARRGGLTNAAFRDSECHSRVRQHILWTV